MSTTVSVDYRIQRGIRDLVAQLGSLEIKALHGKQVSAAVKEELRYLSFNFSHTSYAYVFITAKNILLGIC